MSPLALSVRFLQTQPDRRLVELARAGHERAFEALVQRYRRPLLRYCRRLTPSDASAEDVLQQALMQAWVAVGNPDVEVREARAWLYRIVHNTAMSQLRRPVHDSLETVASLEVAGCGEDELERRLEARAALAGLASLPEPQRQVMLSTALQGRSHDEVADELGLSHGAVRGLIYRARATLRAAAAALIPSPLVHWAARHGTGTGRSAAFFEALAGGGSIGIGGVIIKGGALVAAAGAIATAAGIAGHSSHARVHRIEAGILSRHGRHRTGAGASSLAAAVTTTSSSAAAAVGSGSRRSATAGAAAASGRSAARGARLVLGGRPVLRLVTSQSGSTPGGSSGSGSGSRHDGGGHGSSGPGRSDGSGSSGQLGGSNGTSGSSGSDGSGGSGHGSSGSSGSGGSGSGDGSGSGSRDNSGAGSGSHDGSGGSGPTTTTATSASAESGDGSGDGSRSGSGDSSSSGSGSAGGSGTGSGSGTSGSGSSSGTTTTHD